MRVGAQRPRVASVPPYVRSDGPDAVEFAGEAGLILDEWQQYVLTESLGERDDGKWAALECGLLVPRQDGKGAIIEARELWGLYAVETDRLLIHTAQEFKTGQEAFLRVLSLIEGNAHLRRQVKRVRTSHGEEGIELHNGKRLRFLARSRTSGRGFSGDVVFIDEAFALTDKQARALIPAVSARPNPQIWYTSSVGDEQAIALAKIRARGHEGTSRRLCFMDWCADEDTDLESEQAILEAAYEANPGLGIRLTEEMVLSEYESLDRDGFAQERLGIAKGVLMGRVIPDAEWRRVQDTRRVEDGGASPVAPIRLAVDVLPDRRAGAIVAGGGGVVEVVEHRDGVGWIQRRAVELARSWGGTVTVDGGGPAASLADDIESEGVTVDRMASPDVVDACARFYDAIMDGHVTVRAHVALTAAVAGVVKRTVGDRFVWSRSKSRADVTPLMAASLGFVPAPALEPLVAVT